MCSTLMPCSWPMPHHVMCFGGIPGTLCGDFDGNQQLQQFGSIPFRSPTAGNLESLALPLSWIRRARRSVMPLVPVCMRRTYSHCDGFLSHEARFEE